MTRYTSRVSELRSRLNHKELRLKERSLEVESLIQNYNLYINREKALKYIILMSEDSTKAVRDHLVSIINKALNAVFGVNRYKFHLESDLEDQTLTLILMENSNGSWRELDIAVNTGEGMGQIISVLYAVILTEVTDHRMLFIFDEVLGGLHQQAVEFVKKCLKQFSKHGAQFAIIEYTFSDFGYQHDLARDEDNHTTSIIKSTNYGLE